MTGGPDKKEVQEFWRSIWGERKEHWNYAQWLENFKRDFEYKKEHEEVEITPEKIKKMLRKMPNWKVCLKKFPSIQEGLRRNL